MKPLRGLRDHRAFEAVLPDPIESIRPVNVEDADAFQENPNIEFLIADLFDDFFRRPPLPVIGDCRFAPLPQRNNGGNRSPD